MMEKLGMMVQGMGIMSDHSIPLGRRQIPGTLHLVTKTAFGAFGRMKSVPSEVQILQLTDEMQAVHRKMRLHTACSSLLCWMRTLLMSYGIPEDIGV